MVTVTFLSYTYYIRVKIISSIIMLYHIPIIVAGIAAICHIWCTESHYELLPPYIQNIPARLTCGNKPGFKTVLKTQWNIVKVLQLMRNWGRRYGDFLWAKNCVSSCLVYFRCWNLCNNTAKLMFGLNFLLNELHNARFSNRKHCWNGTRCQERQFSFFSWLPPASAPCGSVVSRPDFRAFFGTPHWSSRSIL